MQRCACGLLGLLALFLLVTPALAADYYLYAYDSTSGQIRFYSLDKRTGAPLEHPLSPVAVTGGDPGCGGNCQTITADPKREYLFVGTNSGLGVFALGRDGTPSEVIGSPFGGNSLLGVSAQRIGRELVVFGNDRNNDLVRIFAIDLISGMATDVDQVVAGSGSGVLVGIWSTSKALWSVNEGDGTFSAFQIDRRNEAIVPDVLNPFQLTGLNDPFNLIANRRGDIMVLNDCGGAGYGVIFLDKRTGTPLDGGVLASGNLCTEVIGWSRNGKLFYGMGDSGFDVIDFKNEVLIPVPYTFTSSEAGVMGPRGKHLYVSDRRNILHVTLDRRTKLPMVPPASVLIDSLTSDATGMAIVKK